MNCFDSQPILINFMNTATILHFKSEFEALLNTLKIFCDVPHPVEVQTLETVKAFQDKLLWIKTSFLELSHQNQALIYQEIVNFKYPNELTQYPESQTPEESDQISEKILKHSSILLELCQIVLNNPSQKIFDLIRKLMRDILLLIKGEIQGQNNLNPAEIYSTDEIKRLEKSVRRFVRKIDQVQDEIVQKSIDHLKLEIQHYQILARQQKEKLAAQQEKVAIVQDKTVTTECFSQEIQRQKAELEAEYKQQLQAQKLELESHYKQQIQFLLMLLLSSSSNEEFLMTNNLPKKLERYREDLKNIQQYYQIESSTV